MDDKKWQPEVLVLGPGGLKGFLEIGVIEFLNKTNILDDIKIVIGVSRR